jgi:hypothetical protein
LEPRLVGMKGGVAVGQRLQFIEHADDVARHADLIGLGMVAGQSGEAYKVLSQDRRLAVDYVCPSICTFVEDYIEE